MPEFTPSGQSFSERQSERQVLFLFDCHARKEFDVSISEVGKLNSCQAKQVPG